MYYMTDPSLLLCMSVMTLPKERMNMAPHPCHPYTKPSPHWGLMMR